MMVFVVLYNNTDILRLISKRLTIFEINNWQNIYLIPQMQKKSFYI